MRHVAIDAELVPGPQVPLAAAVDVEPHLALHDQRPHRERMRVRLDDGGRRPLALDDLVETLRLRFVLECFERDLIRDLIHR